MKKVITLLLFCSIISSSAFASGFQLNEHGARAMAMAGAFTGLANDPSAIFFNPAGITQLNGTQFYGGATLIMPLTSYTSLGSSPSTTDMVSQVFSPFNLYITHQFSSKFAVGLGINNQYGLGSLWDSNWAGKYLAVETTVKTFYFTPVVAYKLLDNLSISAGPVIAIASIKLSNRVKNPVNADLSPLVTLVSDNSTGYGFTAGILYKPSDQLQLGFSYRSETSFDLTGTASSDPATFKMPVQYGTSIIYVTVPWPNGSLKSKLITPQNATFGLAYMPNNQWTITFDFQYVGWSSYDKLEVTFDTYNLNNPTVAGSSVETVQRQYQNCYIVRFGCEYKAYENFAVRFGFLFDKNPVKDEYLEPTLPDANRLGFNIGFGGKLTEHLGMDFAYLYLPFDDRSVSNSVFGFNGTYKGSAHLIGLNFSYSL